MDHFHRVETLVQEIQATRPEAIGRFESRGDLMVIGMPTGCPRSCRTSLATQSNMAPRPAALGVNLMTACAGGDGNRLHRSSVS